MRDREGYDQEQPGKTVDYASDRTNMVIRYAEVLLIYAEARVMSSGLDHSAYDAINAVRNRVRLNVNTSLSSLAFCDSLVMERAWEFAGCEPITARWLDLVRLERVMAQRGSQEGSLYNQPKKTTLCQVQIKQSNILE
ncbi:RagB/SusD family nutrient uptake outer membrane protein [Carboxylicivirga sp. N1Y90]|uniref:RagB/SusD family nutrient uptake outer membrane protein n=1 Tax=Carboxylicivirga fragile TaxID=3417571 RepID=UPI003D324FF3|nr:RagB/SusD family nutrient uptake outer membrane protein [Marinilabiliaceae bacterium N1Y90]